MLRFFRGDTLTLQNSTAAARRFGNQTPGKLLDRLRERGLYEELTIVITSDHGEEFNEHGGFWHGTTLYDEQVRVPLLVKLSESRRGGTVVRHWVQSIDLMPTILEYVGLSIPDWVEGESLLPLVSRQESEDRAESRLVFSFLHHTFAARVPANADPRKGPVTLHSLLPESGHLGQNWDAAKGGYRPGLCHSGC